MGPLQGASFQVCRHQVEAIGVGPHRRQIGVLVHGWKADPQAETVGDTDLFLGVLGGGDGAATLHVVARHQVAAVGCGDEQGVFRRTGDAAFQRRFQGLGRRGALFEGEVVAEHDEPLGASAQPIEQGGKGPNLVAVNFHQFQRRRLRRDRHEGGFGDRALARAAHAPQQDVVAGQALGKAAQVLHEASLLAIDSHQQVQAQGIVRRRQERIAGGIMPEQFRALER